jgi:hypothetical protein
MPTTRSTQREHDPAATTSVCLANGRMFPQLHPDEARLLVPADGAGVPGPANEPDPMTSRQDAARVLCALFLDNAERGHHAANDELIAELRRRIRAQRHHHRQPPAGCSPPEDSAGTSWRSGSVRSEWP